MRHRIKKEPYPDSKHTLCRSGTEVGYYEYIIKWLTQERRNADIGFGGKSAGWWNHVLGVAQTGKQGKVVHTMLFGEGAPIPTERPRAGAAARPCGRFSKRRCAPYRLHGLRTVYTSPKFL
jgi:hypothetical protein